MRTLFRNYCGVWMLSAALVVASLSNLKPALATDDSKTTAPSLTGEYAAVIQSIATSIQTGKFQEAKTILSQNTELTGAELEQFNLLLAEVDSIQKSRQNTRTEAYRENLELFKELQQPTEKPHDSDEIFMRIKTVYEYSDESQKTELLQDPFVVKTIEDALAKADEFEKAGQWDKAFSQCYYWLTDLFTDNAEYKEHSEKLLEKAALEIALKNNSCENTKEVYEGIKPQMLLRAIGAIDYKYVTVADYREMARKGLLRCRSIGDVLAFSPDNLAFTAENHNIKLWEIGINAILKETVMAPNASRDSFIKVFDEVIELNSISLKLPQEVVVAQFTEAALSALDPYTNLIWPYKINEFQKSITQEFTGIGIRMQKSGKALKVISLIPNTPAYASGLDADDEIVAVDGESTEDMTSNCAVKKITGPKGSKVTLTVKHPDSDETEDLVIVRDKITVPTVTGSKRADGTKENDKWQHMIDIENSIGYVKISNFVEKTVENMNTILDELDSQNVKGLIIDLRHNSGGLLNSAVDMVDMFVDKGLILKSQPRPMVPSIWTAHRRGTRPNYPIVVLINGSSASASEIVAGALQDPMHKRAIIVGSRSYGKGSVQEITDFTGYGSQFKFTTAYYHLPSNQRVKNRYIAERNGETDWGITPDVEVKLLTNERNKLFDIQRDNESLHKAPGEDHETAKRHSYAKILNADPQLAIGLLVLKSKLIQTGQTVVFNNHRENQTAKTNEQVSTY